MNAEQEALARCRRLAILRALEQSREAISASTLAVICAHVGVPSNRRLVINDLRWLFENGFVDLEVGEEVYLATNTDAGDAVARGDETHPAIEKPRRRS